MEDLIRHRICRIEGLGCFVICAQITQLGEELFDDGYFVLATLFSDSLKLSDSKAEMSN